MQAAISSRAGIRTAPHPRSHQAGKCSDQFQFLKALEVSVQSRALTLILWLEALGLPLPRGPHGLRHKFTTVNVLSEPLSVSLASTPVGS